MICRSCGGSTIPLLNLGRIPLANALLNSPEEECESYPLEVRLCTDCSLGQLKDLVPPEKMFREYLYYTSSSPSSVESAKVLVEKILAESKKERLFVVEIASNDGYLLQFYKRQGIQVLGIDPARGPADDAAIRGIPTLQKFFGFELAAKLPRADIIHANNVLAHVPNLNDFVAGIAVLLAPDGICFVEVPYLGFLVERCEFDTVYHEHSYYFSLRALTVLFERYGLFIQDVEPLPVHGGSLRLRIIKRPCGFPMAENFMQYCGVLQSRAEHISRELRSILLDLRHTGKRIWGFGAAAKATVMMNYCNITGGLVDAIADDAPAKIGKYIPGTGIEIRHPDAWLEAQPEYTCIFAWNYADLIRKRYAKSYQGTFFTPYDLPKEVKA
jgi:SAM-dependent methyltransferase